MKPLPFIALDSQYRMTPVKTNAMKDNRMTSWRRRSLEPPGRYVDYVRANSPPKRSSTIKAKTAKEDQLSRNLPRYETGRQSMGSGKKMKPLTRIGVNSPLPIPVKAKMTEEDRRTRRRSKGLPESSDKHLESPSSSFRFAKSIEEPNRSLLIKDSSSLNQPESKVRTNQARKSKARQSMLLRRAQFRRPVTKLSPKNIPPGVPDSLSCEDGISIDTASTLDVMFSASLDGVDYGDDLSYAVSVLDTASITSAVNMLAGVHDEGHSESPPSENNALNRCSERRGSLDPPDSNDVISLQSRGSSILSRQNEKTLNNPLPIREKHTTGNGTSKMTSSSNPNPKSSNKDRVGKSCGGRMENGISPERGFVSRKERTFRGRPTSRIKSRFGSFIVGSGEGNLPTSTKFPLRPTRSNSLPRTSSSRELVSPLPPSCDARKVSNALKRAEGATNPSPKKEFKLSDDVNDPNLASNLAGRRKKRLSHSPPPPPQSMVPPSIALESSSGPTVTKGSAADKSTVIFATNTWQSPLLRESIQRRRAAMSPQ